MSVIRSISEFASQVQDNQCELLRRFFAVQSISTVPLEMNDSAWKKAYELFRPSTVADRHSEIEVQRGDVEHQQLVSIRDLHLHHEAVFNPLRARRLKAMKGETAVELIDRERAENGCDWCDPDRNVQFADCFGIATSQDGRVRARANRARASAISGIVFGHEHNLLRLSKSDFVELFAIAEEYIRQARTFAHSSKFFIVFMNGGWKSASGVAHAHLQVFGRDDRHFAYPANVAARCPSNYWSSVEAIHRDLGLWISDSCSRAWVNITPVKERDLVIASPTMKHGASFIFDILQVLYRSGTNNFTLVAIPSPAYITGDTNCAHSHGFHDWPQVLWRFVDRGDVRARHSDIGGAELFGSTVIASDPWVVARELNCLVPCGS